MGHFWNSFEDSFYGDIGESETALQRMQHLRSERHRYGMCPSSCMFDDRQYLELVCYRAAGISTRAESLGDKLPIPSELALVGRGKATLEGVVSHSF